MTEPLQPPPAPTQKVYGPFDKGREHPYDATVDTPKRSRRKCERCGRFGEAIERCERGCR